MDTNRHEVQQKPRIARISRIGCCPETFRGFSTDYRWSITDHFAVRNPCHPWFSVPSFIGVHSWL